ncbi:MAG: TolC family protein [Armatimonadota bacterium]
MTARHHCRLIAGVLALAWAGLACAQQPVPAPLPETITVEQAVAYALEHNPSIIVAVQDVQIAQAQVDIARANRRPDVGVSVSGTYNPSPTEVSFGDSTIQLGEKFGSTLGVNVSQPVWPNTRWRAPIAGATANLGANTEILQRTRETVVYQTRQVFYQVLSAQRLQEVAQESVQAAQTQLRLAESTVAAGYAAPLDIYQARATLADAQVTLARAQNAVDLARAALVTQMGLPAGTPLQVQAPAGLPAVPPNLDDLTQAALRQRSELAQLNFRRQQVRAQIDLIRLQQQPLVNVQANYSKDLTSATALGASGLTFGASIGLSVYNGGQTRAELEAARTQLAQLDTNARQLELGITLEVRQAYLGLQNALQQLTAAEEGLRAAAEALRIAQIRYENGEGIILEVEQARVRRTQAQTALAQARYQAQVSAAQLAFALGEPAP